MPIELDGLSYNFDDKIITVLDPATELDLQDLVNTTRAVEAYELAINDNQILRADGKQPLGGGQLVGITVSLINGWRIAFESQGSPSIRQVVGGNLVAFVDEGTITQFPIAPATNVSGYIAQSSSATQNTAASNTGIG